MVLFSRIIDKLNLSYLWSANRWRLYCSMTSSTSHTTNIQLDNPKEAYRNKSTAQLMRAYVVFRMCSVDYVVEKQMSLLKWSHKVLGRRIFRQLMKMTVYGQFIGGESNEEVLQRAAHHRKCGVYPMFQYTARETHGVPPELKAISRHADDFDEHGLWEENVKECLNSIKIGAQSQSDSMYSIVTTKLTFFGSSELMRKLNSVMQYNFKMLEGSSSLLTEEARTAVTEACTNLITNKGKLPLPDQSQIRAQNTEALLHNVAFHLELNTCLQKIIKPNKLDDMEMLSEKDVTDMTEIWNRINMIGSLAEEHGVTLGMDAEQTYLQVLFDLITLDMMRQFNRNKPIVQNTYQTYLKNTDRKVARHVNIAEKENFKFGCRVVRGGYMDEERKLAEKHNYEDPVNPTYDATTDMYQKTALWLMNRVKVQPKGHMKVLFASHNEDTIKYIISNLESMKIQAEDQCVSVAQLLGMRDHVSFTLGQAGYPVHKLIHYGEIEECMAYLSRRMKENRSGMATADLERNLLGSELKRRLFRIN